MASLVPEQEEAALGMGWAEGSLARAVARLAPLAREMRLQSTLKLIAFARPIFWCSDFQHSCQNC